MEPWDLELIRRQGPRTLVQIAREGRLRRVYPAGSCRVYLSWVDEAALALVELAVAQRRSINLVYPAPAGEVSVLLAAQILLHRFIRGQRSASVGIVTADPAGAARVWRQLAISPGPGSRTMIEEVFPYRRADPSGDSPFGRASFAGVLIGNHCRRWRVDAIVMDYLAGPVTGEPDGSVVRVFSDPLDYTLQELATKDELIWGWSDSILGLWHGELQRPTPHAIPFSVAHDRFRAISDGVELTICCCEQEEAALALGRVRDDLLTLRGLVGNNPPRHIELGMRVAWSHTSTLAALPCKPSEYDEFSGLPPRAARSTASFARELQAWAETLQGQLAEYASITATDISELRAALENGNPFVQAIASYARGDIPTLVILKTKTAKRALLASLGGDPEADGFMRLKVTWLGALHRYGNFSRAVVVGSPPRSAWHRLDSGISRDLHILVLGEDEERRMKWAIATVRAARARWSSTDVREKAWRTLVKEDPPPPPIDVPYKELDVSVVAGPKFKKEPDPFSPLGSLLRNDRPLLQEEGIDEQVAQEATPGHWEAMVDAVEIETDHGYLVVPSQREIDVLEDEPTVYAANLLRPGMRIIVGRQSGRIGLIEALEDRLEHRPDLLAARLLVRDYRERTFVRFIESGLPIVDLHQKLRSLGSTRVLETVRSWVIPGGPMAPRDLLDLDRLNDALNLGYSEYRIREIFSALTRIRTFRRAAGRALARAAEIAATTKEDLVVDPETGLSVADLREAVIVPTVRAVRSIPERVRLAETGRIEEESRII